jgi:NADH-quinone oxidoreductase subunit N
MTLTAGNLLGFIPELWLLAGALVILGLTAARPSRSGRAPTLIALVALLGSLAALGTQLRTPLNILNGAFVLDGFAALLDAVLLISAGVVLLVSLQDLGPPDRALAFILLATCGALLLVSAADLLAFFAALQLLAVSTAIAVGLWGGHRRAAVGPLVVQLAGSAAIVYGLAVAYGLTGETSFLGVGRVLATRAASDAPTLLVLVLVVGGAAFGLGVAAFGWLTEGYEDDSGALPALAATLLLVAGLGSLQRLVTVILVGTAIPWAALLAVLGAVVMTGGTIGALGERQLARALAYALVGQTGFILAGLAAGRPAGVAGVGLLLVGTAPGVLAAAIAIAWFARLTGASRLGDFAGMMRRAPFPALVLALGVSSLAGLPPLIGFFGRFLILVAAVESGYTWLGLLGLVNLLLLSGWAIRVVRLVALEAAPTETPEPAPDWAARVALAAVSAGVAVLVFLLSPIANAAATVAQRLPK